MKADQAGRHQENIKKIEFKKLKKFPKIESFNFYSLSHG